MKINVKFALFPLLLLLLWSSKAMAKGGGEIFTSDFSHDSHSYDSTENVGDDQFLQVFGFIEASEVSIATSQNSVFWTAKFFKSVNLKKLSDRIQIQSNIYIARARGNYLPFNVSRIIFPFHYFW